MTLPGLGQDEDAFLEAQYEDANGTGRLDEEPGPDEDYEPCGASEGLDETCDAPCVRGEGRCSVHLEED
jgi:hypothetical protein